MVEQITCYRDSSGKLHETPLDAHRAELAIWLAATGLINEASAQQLAEKLADNAHDVVEILSQISRLTPTAKPPMMVVA